MLDGSTAWFGSDLSDGGDERVQTRERNSAARSRTRSAATLVLAFALGVGLVLGLITLFGESAPSPAADEGGTASSTVATIAFVVVAAFLALAVHEIGHAIGGRLHGMRLGMLIVGPVHIQREPDGRLAGGSTEGCRWRAGWCRACPEAPKGCAGPC